MTAVRSQGASTESAWRAVTWLFVLLLALVVAHDVDHVVNEERLYELKAPFWIFLPFQYGTFLAVLYLVWRREPYAPTFAAALGAISFFVFIVSHVLPFGLAPYADGDPIAINWALVFVPMAVAAALFFAALRLRALTGAAGRPQTSRA